MPAKISYQGQERAAFIVQRLTRYGEPFIEAVVEGCKTTKVIHANHIIESKTA